MGCPPPQIVGSLAELSAALPGLTRLCLRCRMESAALAPELLEGLSQVDAGTQRRTPLSQAAC